MTIKNLLIGLVCLVMFIGLFVYSVFWGHFTNFYNDCIRIQVGMSATDAELTMQKYINNSKFFVAKEGALWGPGLYISSNFSNHQCKIQIREEKVTDIDAVFD